MRKRFFFLLAVLLLTGMCCSGCMISESDAPLELYYRTAEVTYAGNGLVEKESGDRNLERTVDAVAERYFAGPQSEQLVSPFPKGTALAGYELNNGVLYLETTSALAGLSGADLSLALTCINLTFSQLDGVDAVEISAQDNTLGGQESVRLDTDRILLEDNSMEIAENTLNIYYADTNYRYLMAHQVKTKLEKTADQAAYAVSLLASEPENSTMHSTLPRNTEVLDLSIENEVCIVDFSDDFYRNRPSSEKSERLTILSIVNTLTEFDEIKSVQFYVEGEALSTYYTMDLSLNYVRDENAIGPVRSGLNELDVSLSVIRKNDWVLTRIPTRVRSAANETEADSVLNALLNFGEINGFISPIPVDTEVLSLTERGNHCYVDLSRSFADGLTTRESEELAVRSIVASLTSLGNIHYVSISIEGEPEGLQYVDLRQVFEQ